MTQPRTSTNGNQAKNPKDRGPKPPQPPREQAAPGRESLMSPRPDYGLASYRGHGRLKDKIALITGADSGIGRAVALAFAREGADVVIGYSSEHDDAEETARAVEASGRKALEVSADIGKDSEVKKLVDEAVRRFGRIDVLVNNAAKQGKAVESFEELDAERVEATFRVNVISMFHLVRHALPHLRPGSAIIRPGLDTARRAIL